MGEASFCSRCKNKICLATKVPCKAVERILKKVTTGRRNWLTSMEPEKLENLAAVRAFRIRYGKTWAKQPKED
jgi:hypothetical protein